MKDPAFLFYYQDFLVGCNDLTNEETGAYIRSLCMQAAKGGITEKHMLIICNSHEVHNVIKEKFVFNPELNLYENLRLKAEMEKRKSYSESRSKNRKPSVNKGKPPKQNEISYDKHMEDENENEDVIENVIKNEEKIKIGAICEFFGFSELNHSQNYFQTHEFVECLTNRNQISHFEKQFQFYKQVKTESGFKHNFKNFIGSAEKFYEDGAWNAENWETKVSKKPEKTTFENVGKNQDEKYKKMRIQFANQI